MKQKNKLIRKGYEYTPDEIVGNGAQLIAGVTCGVMTVDLRFDNMCTYVTLNCTNKRHFHTTWV